MNNNGRVNIMSPNIDALFNMKDRIPKETFDYRDAVTGNWYRTQLSDLFFSKENISLLQNGIRAGVFKMSNNKYIVGAQDCDVLQIIMRSIFLQNSKNNLKNITGQIETLNKLVLDYSVKQVYGEANGYIKYKYDVSNLAEPMARPVMSKINDKQLELKNWF
jgi:hypothetical protein